MRLRTFHGSTVTEVMQAVRKELGENAIIVSTLESENGVKITAALELEDVFKTHEPEEETALESTFTPDDLCDVLKYHGVGDESLEALMQALAPVNFQPEPGTTLWESVFSYSPLEFKQEESPSTMVLMLIGSPGSGKSVTIAKLAAQALLSGKFVNVITCDAQKAGAVSQLSTYMEALDLNLNVAHTTEELRDEVKSTPEGSVILIDTPGINTYDPQEVNSLAEKVVALKVSPIWVCPAGEHPDESLEKMEVLQSLGCSRMIISKLDTVRRVSGALTSCLDKGMSLVGLSDSPMIADEIIPANSNSFSTLLTKTDDNISGDDSYCEEREII